MYRFNQTRLLPARLLFLMVALLALSACQNLQPSDIQSADALAANHQLTKWRAEGKIKIVANGDSQTAAFDWQQHKGNYAIHFFGPFGAGSSWLRRTSKGVTLELPDRPPMRADSPEQLLFDAAGWQAPISHLQHWIKGVPAPQIPSKQNTETVSEVITFEQENWQISAERLKDIEGFLLPGKVIGTDGQTQVTVIIKRWEKR